MLIRILVFIALLACVGCDGFNKFNPVNPSGFSSQGPDLWIHPNVGSADFLQMFTNPELWSEARSRVSTFQFHQGNLLRNCSSCGENTYDKFIEAGVFRKLSEWNKGISFEAGAFKYWGGGCLSSIPPLINDAIEAIDTVRAGGGVVNYISMDEPFIAGLECGFTEDQTAQAVASFINGVNSVYPYVRVGLTEAYPTFTPETMVRNVEALERAGIHLPFLHLDIDRYGAQRQAQQNDGLDRNRENSHGYNIDQDMQKMRDFTRRKVIPLGLIIWGEDGTSSESFTADSVLLTRAINVIMNDVERVIFESWSDYLPARSPGSFEMSSLRLFPRNLPETQPGTLTYLLNLESRRFQ